MSLIIFCHLSSSYGRHGDGTCAVPEGTGANSAILGTAQRVFAKILPIALLEIGDRPPYLPPTKNEVKSNIYETFHADEAAKVCLLGRLGSEACRIFGKLGRGRPLVRKVMSEFNMSRLK